jgi:hypothetical protein
MKHAKVRFEHGGGEILSLLEIRTPATTSPVSARLGQVLFDLSVQVVRSDTREESRTRIERLWVVDFDGAPLRAQRRFELQVEVLRAIDSPPAGPPPVRPRPLRRVPPATPSFAPSQPGYQPRL